VTLSALLLAALLALFGVHPQQEVADAIARLSAEHHADPALVAAICQRESQSGTYRGPHLLCGAHVRIPRDPSAPARLDPRGRPLPQPFDRSVAAQVGFVAALFGHTSRCAWTPMLKSYRCGGDRQCRETSGAAYARIILGMRDAIHGRMQARRTVLAHAH
jgi:hypothetical protein